MIGTDNLLYSEYWTRTVLVYQLIFSHVLIAFNNLHEQAVENINLTRLKNLDKRISLLHIQGVDRHFKINHYNTGKNLNLNTDPLSLEPAPLAHCSTSV